MQADEGMPIGVLVKVVDYLLPGQENVQLHLQCSRDAGDGLQVRDVLSRLDPGDVRPGVRAFEPDGVGQVQLTQRDGLTGFADVLAHGRDGWRRMGLGGHGFMVSLRWPDGKVTCRTCKNQFSVKSGHPHG